MKTLIKNTTIIIMNENLDILENYNLVIEGDKISKMSNEL